MSTPVRRALRKRGNTVSATSEPALVRRILILFTVLVCGLILVLPVGVVFGYAFSEGVAAYVHALRDPYALQALQLTLWVTAIAVVMNLLFGLCAAWCLGKFRFVGRSFILAVLDVPFAVSPVIAGLILVLLFGVHGVFGPILVAYDFKVIFAWPGIVFATIFVTLPFVAREIIPLMEEQGKSEEEAALSMGASGWQVFWNVTLPNIKWALLYGVILTNARAMGEFGAVSVVSGHIRGQTNTLPLHIEVLYNEFNTHAAFAASSLLACLALVTLIVKTVIESRYSST